MSEKQLVVASGARSLAVGGAPELLPDQFNMYMSMAAVYHRSGTLKTRLPDTESVFFGLMLCRDLGLSPTLGLPYCYQIKGRVNIEARAKLAAVEGRLPDFQWEFIDKDGKVVDGPVMEREPGKPTKGYCRIRAWVGDKAKAKIGEFDMDRARSAGLVKADSAWANYEEDMLISRALTRVLPIVGGAALFGMAATMEAADHGAVDLGDAEVVEGDGAQKSLPPQQEVADWRETRDAFLELSKKIGWVKKDAQKRIVNLLLSEHDRKQVASATDVAPVEWPNLLSWLRERYDGNGKAINRNAVEATAEVVPETAEAQVEANREVNKKLDALEPPISPSVEALTEALPAPEPDPEPEPFDKERAAIEAALIGSPEALVALAETAEAAFTKAGAPRRFIRKDGPHTWFTSRKILMDIGSVRMVDGKQEAESALILTTDAKHEKAVSSKGSRVMMARGVLEALATVPSTTVGAKAVAALEAMRGGAK